MDYRTMPCSVEHTAPGLERGITVVVEFDAEQEALVAAHRRAPARLAAQAERTGVVFEMDHHRDALAGGECLLELEPHAGGGDVEGGAVERRMRPFRVAMQYSAVLHRLARLAAAFFRVHSSATSDVWGAVKLTTGRGMRKRRAAGRAGGAGTSPDSLEHQRA